MPPSTGGLLRSRRLTEPRRGARNQLRFAHPGRVPRRGLGFRRKSRPNRGSCTRVRRLVSSAPLVRGIVERLRLVRPVALGATLGLLIACAGEAPQPAASAKQAPAPVRLEVDNLLLVTVDTLRHDALGFSGNPRASTPTLDRLAEAGVVFERAYAHNVVTLPSHANILTGLRPYEHGVRNNDGFVLPESVPTAATWLGEHGFATAAFVAAFPLDRRFGLDRGFDLYDDRYPRALGERRGDEVVAGAVEWWRSHADRRRFLWVHLYDPHAPYEPPRPAADPYLGEVSAVDLYLAPLLGPILEADESTLVAVTADHGEALGEHGELTHGLFAYEAVLRVPLVLWAPGLAAASTAGRRTDIAGHIDLLPTLLAAASVELLPGLPGRNLFAGGAAEPLYFESLGSTLEFGSAPLRGILEGEHKLIELPLPELYNVVADPGEQHNLLTERRDIAQRLAAELPEESVWPPRRDTAAPAAEEPLRSLGYLGGTAPRRETYGVEDDPKRLAHLLRKMQHAVDLMRHGQLAEAEGLEREVIAERADMGMAYHYLAFNLLDQERVPEAIAVMERSRAAGLASPKLLRQLGLSLAEVGRHAEARGILEPLAATGDPRALQDLASVLSEAGNQADAEAALRRLLADNPDDPEALQTLALVSLRRGRPGQAVAAAERAIELDDGLGLAWSCLGEASYALGEKARALEAFERAVAIDPSNFDALYNITLVAAELGETTRLRRALERFIATAPAERYAPHLESARRLLAGLEP
jgi:choline-sulfatase